MDGSSQVNRDLQGPQPLLIVPESPPPTQKLSHLENKILFEEHIQNTQSEIS